MYLEQLARCPEAGDWQEIADLAGLKTPEGVVSLPAPLRFWAEETERSARWRPLRPGALAGLADRSPEGTEESVSAKSSAAAFQRGHSHAGGSRAGSGNGTRSEHSPKVGGYRGGPSSRQRVRVLQPYFIVPGKGVTSFLDLS